MILRFDGVTATLRLCEEIEKVGQFPNRHTVVFQKW